MANSSSAGAFRGWDGDTSGEGVRFGDGVKDDDDASVRGSALSSGSSMPEGNDDDQHEQTDLLWRPNWSGDECSDGSWHGKPSGGGESEAEETRGSGEAGSGHGGNYGILTANWGGHWSENALQQHMLRDLKSTPCHILCVQEAEQDFFDHLRSEPGTDDGGRRRGSRFIGVRGPEPVSFHSLMICARKSLVSGLRLMLFHRTLDGPYQPKTKKARKRKRRGKLKAGS